MSDIKPIRPANGGADVAYAHAHRTDFMEFGPGTNGFIVLVYLFVYRLFVCNVW